MIVLDDKIFNNYNFYEVYYTELISQGVIVRHFYNVVIKLLSIENYFYLIYLYIYIIIM